MHCVSIQSLDLQMTAPEELVEMQDAGTAARYCFEAELQRRTTRCITIMAVDGIEEPVTSWDTLPVGDGGVFHYTRETHEVGSGGPEEIVRGYLQLAGRSYKITANAQSRTERPDAGWALSIIQSMRPGVGGADQCQSR
jgi:hypothetical protein